MLEWMNDLCHSYNQLSLCARAEGTPVERRQGAQCVTINCLSHILGDFDEKKKDFHLENEILVFKVGALVQRKKGMVYIFVKHEIL